MPDTYCFFQDIEPRDPMVARFDHDYLLHAVKGALNVEVAGKRWLLPRTFAAWVPAETDLTVILDKPVTSCSILAKPGFAAQMPDHPVAFQMSRLVREMALHCRNWGKDAAHPPEARTFFQALFNTCAGLIANSIDVARPTSDDPQLANAIKLIETKLDQDLTTATVADAAALSERTLQRKFAAEFGESWQQTRTRIRMIRALGHLADDTLSIIQIAGECGYASTSAFNRSFKDYAGTTPSEFRKHLK